MTLTKRRRPPGKACQKMNLLEKILIKLKFVSKPPYYVSPKAIIKAPQIVIGTGAEIGDYVVIQCPLKKITIGEHTQINYFTVIYGGEVHIGNNVMIAPHVMIASGNHDFVQTEKPMRFAGDLTKGPIRIEDNVWIGSNCTITDGVTIGRDAVVGANSVVTRDVAPYDIVAGAPARFVRNRKDLQQKAP
jgi:acetyltransferase-like isoleucine patch superfamily enzyme